ncbi:SURF1 family protein [Agarivorans gilvus]|uniref:SURF1-like protein n=1 Tax=Agarivorans gilvus TaxID=680279 RepID=A0ABQ1I325_9ALTE|nr:SURF1 family protein [Agarivorans gilvus]GGB11716.1 SURF1-like protein [Agarivorans gilvus]
MAIAKTSQCIDRKPVSYRLWLFVLLMVALIALMVKLSLWQWQRAEQKQQLLEQYLQLSQQASSLQAALSEGPKAFQRVEVSQIQALNQLLWLDNQIQNGRVGYDVFTLAATPQGKVLVRLGWQPAPMSRGQLPEAPRTENLPQQYRLRQISHSLLLDKQHWLESLPQGLRVQQIDLAGLAAHWQVELLPFVLDSQLQFSSEQLVAMPPHKHQAYALQWLLMAIVASGLTIYFCWRSRNKESA